MMNSELRRMLACDAACNAQAAIDCEFIVGLAEPICLVRSTPTGRQRKCLFRVIFRLRASSEPGPFIPQQQTCRYFIGMPTEIVPAIEETVRAHFAKPIE
jgi:hypothetical protein